MMTDKQKCIELLGWNDERYKAVQNFAFEYYVSTGSSFLKPEQIQVYRFYIDSGLYKLMNTSVPSSSLRKALESGL